MIPIASKGRVEARPELPCLVRDVQSPTERFFHWEISHLRLPFDKAKLYFQAQSVRLPSNSYSAVFDRSVLELSGTENQQEDILSRLRKVDEIVQDMEDQLPVNTKKPLGYLWFKLVKEYFQIEREVQTIPEKTLSELIRFIKHGYKGSLASLRGGLESYSYHDISLYEKSMTLVRESLTYLHHNKNLYSAILENVIGTGEIKYVSLEEEIKLMRKCHGSIVNCFCPEDMGKVSVPYSILSWELMELAANARSISKEKYGLFAQSNFTCFLLPLKTSDEHYGLALVAMDTLGGWSDQKLTNGKILADVTTCDSGSSNGLKIIDTLIRKGMRGRIVTGNLIDTEQYGMYLLGIWPFYPFCRLKNFRP